MAPADAGEPEYESDPKELKRSLATRRREASDDDDHEGVKHHRAEIGSDSEQSDEEGGTVKYDNRDKEEEGDGYREGEVDDDKRATRKCGSSCRRRGIKGEAILCGAHKWSFLYARRQIQELSEADRLESQATVFCYSLLIEKITFGESLVISCLMLMSWAACF